MSLMFFLICSNNCKTSLPVFMLIFLRKIGLTRSYEKSSVSVSDVKKMNRFASSS